jgi:pilus assembly protein FimV
MKRKKLPADQAMRASTSTEKPLWRTTALAVATAVLYGFSASDARALALGRITVQSALGEPLRAEIDIPEIDADEVASLRANIAAPDAFKTAGFDYNPTLTGIRITLEKRADGRYFLRLVSPRPVNDPFVDLILESSWSSGRVVRDYTMLFDPPITRQAQPLSAELPPSAPAGRAATTAPATAATPASPGTAAATPASPGTAAATPASPGTAATPASAGTAAATPASPDTAATPAAADATPASPGTPDATPATPVADASAPPTSSPASTPRTPGGEGNKQVTVRSGDTAGKIAGANKPANVSLDQMLVAMLRSNPDAFADGNINRLRSGAVLEMPSAEDAALVPTDEAKQLLVAQSRDFNEFRRRLAESVPAKQVTPADRQASGKITAQVEEKRPAASAPDKLTLSKGSVQGKSGIAAEEKIAQDRASQDSAARVAELNKNITDLSKLGKSSAAPATPASAAKGGLPVPVGAPATTATAAASALKSPAPAVPPPAPAALASAPAPVAKASATSPAPAASPAPTAASSAVAASAATPAVAPVLIPASAVAPAPSQAGPAASAASAAASSGQPAVAAKPASAAKPAAKPVPPPPPEPSLIDELMENWPIAAGGLGAIIALVAGLGFYRARQRKTTAQVDSSFLESRLQPDSFFGASGGQRIDTNEGGVSGSSLVYSPSQLDAAGDVDPVAEADVYLAYGRDLQAEEILKEAMRTQPQRVAIHVKLLEIYAKRRDTRAFELVATEAYSLTHGSGAEWERICELGKDLDSSNSLYRPGGEPGAPGPKSAPAPAAAPTNAIRTQPMAPAPAVAAVPEPEPAADIDLDLDFSFGDEPAAAQVAAPVSERTHPVQAASAELMPALDMDFGATQATAAQPARLDAPDLTLNENSLNFDLSAPQIPAAAAPAAPTATAPAADSGMLEFDLGGLSLDLGTPASKAAAPATASEPDTEAPITAGAPLSTGEFEDSSGDPLATKFALAKEFHSIGDPDGARSLAQEVLAEASGELKAAAQRFLAEVG